MLARRLGIEDDRARAAAMLIAFSPAALLYGVLSTDAMFATLGLVAACLLVGSGLLSWIAGGIALAVASFFSWALLAVGAFAAVVQLLRRGLGSAIGMAVVAGVILLGGYLGLYAATGFDPIGSVRAAGDAYDLGISNARPYLFWLFGSPVAFAVALGIPTAWFAARALGSRQRGRDRPRRDRRRLGRDRADQGRDGAHLAVHGPARRGRGGHAGPAPADAGDLRRSSSRRRSPPQILLDTIW